MANELTYAFFANKPEGPLSYSALQTRRKIAETLLGKRSPYPKTFGEGLTYAGERISDIARMRALDEQEAERQGFLGDEARRGYEQPSITAPGARTEAPTEAPAANEASTPPAAEPETKVAALAPGDATPAPNPMRDRLAVAMLRPAIDRTALPPAGPVGNAGASFGPSMTNPITGATRPVPTQPSPDRFSREFGPLADVQPERVAAIDAIDPGMLSSERTADVVPATVMPSGADMTPRTIARAAQSNFAPIAGAPVVAFSGQPSDQGEDNTLTGITRALAPPSANPPIMTNIPAAPPQIRTAQAGQGQFPLSIAPRQAREAVEINQPEPTKPSPLPQSDRERMALMRMAMYPDDPDVQRIWEPIAKQAAAERLFNQKQLETEYRNRLTLRATLKVANQAKARSAEADDLARAKEYVDLFQNAPAGMFAIAPGMTPMTAGAPAASPASANIPGAPPVGTSASGIRGTGNGLGPLGSQNSPQRTGIPALPPNPGIPPAKWQEQMAPELKGASTAVEKAEPQFKQAIDLLEQIRKHKGANLGIGLTGEISKHLYGQDVVDFHQLVEQLKNKNWLNAYNTLKGGGPISNIEGAKAESAVGRLATTQTKAGFFKALFDLENVFRSDLELAQRKVNHPVTAWRVNANDQSFAPDKGEIRKGREFLGGNPGLPSNWVPINAQ